MKVEKKSKKLVVANTTKEGQSEFNWDGLENENTRLKEYSKKFKNKSLLEAFDVIYPELQLSGKEFKNDVNKVVKELSPGMTLELTIDQLGKTNTTFQGFGIKESVTSKQALSKFETIKRMVEENPGQPLSITAQVVSNERGKVVVDVIKPLYDAWVKQVLSSSSKQMGMVQTVENLQLVKGGYVGKINIGSISNLTGTPYEVSAFIPGSQIALNIEDNFEKWVGKSVEVFVTNQVEKGDNVSFICSRKNVLQYIGNVNLVNMFNLKEMSGSLPSDLQNGVITGILHSAKVCGVFVEIPTLSITGMVEVSAKDLVEYGVGKQVTVKLDKLEVPNNQAPYKLHKEKLIYCNIKPMFKLV